MAPVKAAFSVKLSNVENHNIGRYEVIKVTDILTNVGGYYSSSTGEFAAPADGTYFFFSSLFSCVNGFFETEIIRNGVVMASLRVDDKSGHETAVTGLTMVLNKGDIVAVRHKDHEGECIHGNNSNFSGFQL